MDRLAEYGDEPRAKRSETDVGVYAGLRITSQDIWIEGLFV